MEELHDAILETLPELLRWLPWARPDHARSDTRRYVRHARLARARRASYEFAVCASASGRLLGIVGLHRLDWSRRAAALGYWIRRSEWGKGFATEAGACIVQHGFRALGLNRIEAHVAPVNHRSQRVVEKLGFSREGIAREIERIGDRYLDHVQYSLLRREVLGPEQPEPEEIS